jgi:hypothetical protein
MNPQELRKQQNAVIFGWTAIGLITFTKKGYTTMRFIVGFLLGYCIRGKKPLLVAALTAIAFVAFVCFIVLPAIALTPLAISVRRERLSRPPQTTVPVVVGLSYKTAEIKLREANLNIRVLANRHDLPLEPGLIIDQTPRAGERVDWGTVIGVTISAEPPEWMR